MTCSLSMDTEKTRAKKKSLPAKSCICNQTALDYLACCRPGQITVQSCQDQHLEAKDMLGEETLSKKTNILGYVIFNEASEVALSSKGMQAEKGCSEIAILSTAPLKVKAAPST